MESGASLHELRLDDFQIVGIFKDSGGNPLSGVGVELERQVRGTDGSVLEAPNSLKKSGPVHVTSNSKGQFEFSGVPSGKWQIRVRGQAWTSPLSNLFKVDDANLNLGVITLSGSCSINLQLSAQALHDVELRGGQRPDLELLHLQSQLRFLLHPDDRGRVNRSDLPAGEYELLVADRPSTLVRLSTAQPTELVLN